MKQRIDYAKTAHMDAWLRHPVLGDPSFDTFTRLGEAIHRSQPPYDWAVNTSLFRDHDGTWYCYAGLYERSYFGTREPRFRIYRSTDQGQNWEDLGWGFETGFRMEGDAGDSDVCPDVVVFYDEKVGKYLMTYDTASVVDRKVEYDGVALAWADTPAGPFTRLPQRIVTSGNGSCGKYTRHYASTVIPRKQDYLALVLTDSGRYHAWALTALTAPTPDGPWTKPHVVLCCDRPEYYPCPVEFYPAYVLGDTVYSPATSVAQNRNYQAIFEAPLEQAHDPSAWKLTANGNVWHSRNIPEEALGIWGQTYHGFVEPDTGRFVVAYPSKNAQDQGIISLAQRPWDTPHSDGFTISAHGGTSISPLLCSYEDFSLDAAFSCGGTVDIAFGYGGILGPDDSRSDSSPCAESLSNYSAVRICGKACQLITVDENGAVSILAGVTLKETPERLQLTRNGSAVTVRVNDTLLCEELPLPEISQRVAPLALVLQCHSFFQCQQFAVTGTPGPYSLAYNATDALLGAGQWLPDPELVDPMGTLTPDVWHRIPGGYVGQGHIAGKWNVIGSQFEIPLKRSPAYGTIGIWVDGHFNGSVDLQGEGETSYQTAPLCYGCHAIRVAPLKGRIAITGLIVSNP